MLYVALEGQIRVKQVKVRVGNWQGWHSAAGRRFFFGVCFFGFRIKKTSRRKFLKIKRINNIGELRSAAILPELSPAGSSSAPVPKWLWFYWPFRGFCGTFQRLAGWNSASGFSSRRGEAFQWRFRKGADEKSRASKRRKKSNSRFRVLPDW